MTLDIHTWMGEYLEKLQSLFGTRLVFVGLQGSYGRDEATARSDIDAVVILDRADPADLHAYAAMLDTLPHREKACGFISGKQELLCWERSELFQFYHDTTPVWGSLDFLPPLIGEEDIRRAVRMGACGIYHTCGHNMVHEKDPEILKALFKTAAVALQALHFVQTGTYIRGKSQLLPLLPPREREILKAGLSVRQEPALAETDFARLSQLLFHWAAELIVRFRDR